MSKRKGAEVSEVVADSKEDWDQTLRELIELQKGVVSATEKYRTRCKEVFGFADGEPMNLIQLTMLIRGLKV